MRILGKNKARKTNKADKKSLLRNYQVGMNDHIIINAMVELSNKVVKSSGSKRKVSDTIKEFAEWEIQTGHSYYVLMEFLEGMYNPYQVIEDIGRFAKENDLKAIDVMKLVGKAGDAIIKDKKEWERNEGKGNKDC